MIFANNLILDYNSSVYINNGQAWHDPQSVLDTANKLAKVRTKKVFELSERVVKGCQTKLMLEKTMEYNLLVALMPRGYWTKESAQVRRRLWQRSKVK